MIKFKPKSVPCSVGFNRFARVSVRVKPDSVSITGHLNIDLTPTNALILASALISAAKTHAMNSIKGWL